MTRPARAAETAGAAHANEGAALASEVRRRGRCGGRQALTRVERRREAVALLDQVAPAPRHPRPHCPAGSYSPASLPPQARQPCTRSGPGARQGGVSGSRGTGATARGTARAPGAETRGGVRQAAAEGLQPNDSMLRAARQARPHARGALRRRAAARSALGDSSSRDLGLARAAARH